jgi:hypothetical protein
MFIDITGASSLKTVSKEKQDLNNNDYQLGSVMI